MGPPSAPPPWHTPRWAPRRRSLGIFVFVDFVVSFVGFQSCLVNHVIYEPYLYKLFIVVQRFTRFFGVPIADFPRFPQFLTSSSLFSGGLPWHVAGITPRFQPPSRIFWRIHRLSASRVREAQQRNREEYTKFTDIEDRRSTLIIQFDLGFSAANSNR